MRPLLLTPLLLLGLTALAPRATVAPSSLADLLSHVDGAADAVGEYWEAAKEAVNDPDLAANVRQQMDATRQAAGAATEAARLRTMGALDAAQGLSVESVKEQVEATRQAASSAANGVAKSTRRLAEESIDAVSPYVKDGLAAASDLAEGAVDHVTSSAAAATKAAASSLLNGAKQVIWQAVCGPNPCTNEGECVISRASDSQYTCLCPDGYSGDNCESRTACDSKPCLNGGVCSFRGPTGPSVVCACSPGFSGPLCQTKLMQRCPGDVGCRLPTAAAESTPQAELSAAAAYAMRAAVLLGLLGVGYLVLLGQVPKEEASPPEPPLSPATATDGGASTPDRPAPDADHKVEARSLAPGPGPNRPTIDPDGGVGGGEEEDSGWVAVHKEG